VNIHDVHEGIVKFKKRKRLGRGTGSGLGKTSGRGHKGQRSRAGHSQHPTFQGGAMPMILEARFDAGAEVTPETLKAKNLANYNYRVLKVLGTGEITKALTVSAHKFSASAKEKIEKAGGKIVVLPMAKPVVKNKMKAPAK